MRTNEEIMALYNIESAEFEKYFDQLAKKWEKKRKGRNDLKFVETADRWIEELKNIKDSEPEDDIKQLARFTKFRHQLVFLEKFIIDLDLDFETIFLHDKTEALRILLTNSDDFSDCEYWQHLKYIYTMLPRDKNKIPLLKRFFTQNRGCKDCLMTDEEHNFLKKLPSEINIYRGMTKKEAKNRNYGISWTLDKSVAEFFAFEHPDDQFPYMEKTVVQKTIDKEEVIAYFKERKEEEIIWISNG